MSLKDASNALLLKNVDIVICYVELKIIIPYTLMNECLSWKIGLQMEFMFFLRIYFWNNTLKNTFLTLTIKSHVGKYPTNVIYLKFCMTLK